MVPESTLQTWFGDVDAEDFEERFAVVYSTLAVWSFRFRHGFYSWKSSLSFDLPVLLSCRPEVPGAGSHKKINEIELRDEFFSYSKNATPITTRQIQVLLHEMGHWARVDWFPFLGSLSLQGTLHVLQDSGVPEADLDDQEDDDCILGKTGGDNRCYCEFTDDVWEGVDIPFSGSPNFATILPEDDATRLVTKFQSNVSGAKTKMLNNIDNYVGYLWNRWVDHGYCKLNPT